MDELRKKIDEMMDEYISINKKINALLIYKSNLKNENVKLPDLVVIDVDEEDAELIINTLHDKYVKQLENIVDKINVFLLNNITGHICKNIFK